MESRVLKVGVRSYLEKAMEHCAVHEKTLMPTATCPEPGLAEELLGRLLNSTGIKYEVIPMNSLKDWGTKINGTWTGLLGLIFSGQLDVSSVPYNQVEERNRDFSFSNPILFHPFSFLTLAQKPHLSMVLLTVFDKLFWALTAASLLAVFTLLLLDSTLQIWTADFQWKKLHKVLCRSFWTIVSFVFSQFSETGSRVTLTRKMTLTALGILTLLIVGLYQGSLLSFLLVKGPEIIDFQRTEELAGLIASGDRYLIAVTDHSADGYFLSVRYSPLSGYKKMKKVLEKRKPTEVPNIYEALEELHRDRKAVLVTDFITAKRKALKDCHLRFQEDKESNSRLGFVFRKNDSAPKLVSEAINRNYPMIRHLVDVYRKNKEESRCLKSERFQALSWEHTCMIFAVGGAGYGFACLQLILENIWSVLKRFKRSMVWHLEHEQ